MLLSNVFISSVPCFGADHPFPEVAPAKDDCSIISASVAKGWAGFGLEVVLVLTVLCQTHFLWIRP